MNSGNVDAKVQAVRDAVAKIVEVAQEVGGLADMRPPRYDLIQSLYMALMEAKRLEQDKERLCEALADFADPSHWVRVDLNGTDVTIWRGPYGDIPWRLAEVALEQFGIEVEE